MNTVVILGCGYTGRVVATRLIERGLRVIATSRSPEQLAIPGAQIIGFDALGDELDLGFVPPDAGVVYSIPILAPDPTATMVRALGSRPQRFVYLSTTGVYGAAFRVDHRTQAAPSNLEGRARLQAEAAVLEAPHSSVVLRPAAIYGPGRGVHARMRAGTFRLAGDGRNFVSRIHVDDLASHVVAALFSSVEGAWPVADAEACTSTEIAEFCAALLGVPFPQSAEARTLHHTRQANRIVDGSGIRRQLNLELRYPTWREGIPAAMAAELKLSSK